MTGLTVGLVKAGIADTVSSAGENFSSRAGGTVVSVLTGETLGLAGLAAGRYTIVVELV